MFVSIAMIIGGLKVKMIMLRWAGTHSRTTAPGTVNWVRRIERRSVGFGKHRGDTVVDLFNRSKADLRGWKLLFNVCVGNMVFG